MVVPVTGAARAPSFLRHLKHDDAFPGPVPAEVTRRGTPFHAQFLKGKTGRRANLCLGWLTKGAQSRVLLSKGSVLLAKCLQIGGFPLPELLCCFLAFTLK